MSFDFLKEQADRQYKDAQGITDITSVGPNPVMSTPEPIAPLKSPTQVAPREDVLPDPEIMRSILDESENDGEIELNLSMKAAEGRTPEREAEVLRMSKEVNLPVEFVAKNFETIKSEYEKSKLSYKRISRDAPYTAEWLKDPSNAALAKQDLEFLTKLEQAAESMSEGGPLPEELGEFRDAFMIGWNSLEASAYHLAAAYGMQDPEQMAQMIAEANKRSGALREGYPEYAKEFYDVMEPSMESLNERFQQAVSSYKSYREGEIRKALKDFAEGGTMTVAEVLNMVWQGAKRPKGLAYATVENFAYSMPSLAARAGAGKAGAVAGAKLTAVSANPAIIAGGTTVGGLTGFVAGGFAGSAPVQIGAWINEAMTERGYDVTDPESIKKAYQDAELMAEIRAEGERKGLTYAAIEGMFGIFAGKFVAASRGSGVAKRAGAVAADIGLQAVGETSSEFGGQVAARKGDLTKVDFGTSVFEGLISLGHSAGSTAIGATLRPGLPENLFDAVDKLGEQSADAIHTMETMQSVAAVKEYIAQTKLADLAPDKMKELLENITGGEEAKSVYFQVDEWDAYWNSKGISPSEQAQKMMGDQGKGYTDAKATGSQMEIPMAGFLVNVAKTEHFEGLSPSARTEPDGMTFQEASEFMASLPKTMEDLAQEAMQSPAEESAALVGDDVARQLEASGMDTRQSVVVERFFRSMAERAGVDPKELYDKYNIKIARDDVGQSGLFQEAVDPLIENSKRLEAEGFKFRVSEYPYFNESGEEVSGPELGEIGSQFTVFAEDSNGNDIGQADFFVNEDGDLVPFDSKYGDISGKQERIKKAKEMGFDTSTTYYHGGPPGIEEFRASGKTHEMGPGVYLTFSKKVASGFGTVYDLHVKGEIFDYDGSISWDKSEQDWKKIKPLLIDSGWSKKRIARFRESGYNNPNNPQENKTNDWVEFQEVLSESGYTGAAGVFDDDAQVVIFDPENIMSADAALEGSDANDNDGMSNAVRIEEAFRRKGIATELYRQASEATGRPIVRGSAATPEGEAFRDSIADQRRFFQEDMPAISPDALGFYSALERKIIEKVPESVPVEQLRNILKEAKADELKWSGLDDFLKGKNKVSRQEVLDFIRGNRLEITEVVSSEILTPKHDLSEGDTYYSLFVDGDHIGDFQSYDDAASFAHNEGFSDFTIQDMVYDHEVSFIDPDQVFQAEPVDAVVGTNDNISNVPTRFSKYTHSGGENYREIRLTLPPRTANESLIKENQKRIKELEAIIESYDEALRQDVNTRQDLKDRMTDGDLRIYKDKLPDNYDLRKNDRGMWRLYKKSNISKDPSSWVIEKDSTDTYKIAFNADHQDVLVWGESKDEAITEALRYVEKVNEGIMVADFAVKHDSKTKKKVTEDAIGYLNRKYYRDLIERVMFASDVRRTGVRRAEQQNVFDEALASLPSDDHREAVSKAAAAYMEMTTLSRESYRARDEISDLSNVEKGPYGINMNFKHEGHFPEANILAHTRVTTRTDAQGVKSLFLEEIQSDWHQQGRDLGYFSESEFLTSLPEGYVVNQVDKTALTFGDMPNQTQYTVTGPDGTRYAVGSLTEEQAIRRTLTEINRELSISKVPDAPFKKTWHEFAFKRMVRKAIDEGLDRVAWTVGQTQADRYDLSRQVESVNVKKTGPDSYDISAKPIGRRERIDVASDVSSDKLSQHIGKELAEKVLNDSKEEDSGIYTYKDTQLKVGGEGMKGFYDKMLPSFAKKFGKKFGANVGKTAFKGDESEGSFEAHYMDITPAMREAALATGFELFQDQGGVKRGSITFGDTGIKITLGKDMNKSTFFHETGHMYLEIMGDLATKEGASKQIKEDYKTLLKWLGVQSREEIQTEHHEKFARGFEAYIMEGNAPSSALRRAFSAFKEWLKDVYQQLVNLKVELSPEIRDVMNRMLATDEEIQAASQGVQPLFADPAAVGLTGDKAESYVRAREDARISAEDELRAKMMLDHQREQQKIWRERRAKVREEVLADVQENRAYKALAMLQRGKMPDGSDLPEGVTPFKLSREGIVQAYDKAFLKRLPRPMIYAKEGIHHDLAAQLLGYMSGDEMLTELANTIPQKAFVEAETSRRMAERHPDLLFDEEGLRAAATKAIHNEKRAQLLRKELEYLMSEEVAVTKELIRKVARRVPSDKMVKDQAKRIIGSKKVKDIKPHLFELAERKAAKEAGEALAKGDIDLAFQLKSRELLNHELYKEALRAKDATDKVIKYMRRMSEEKTRKRIGKAGHDYLDQIDSILERFDFKKSVSLKDIEKRKSLVQYIESQREMGLDPFIPDKLLNEAYKKNYKEMAYDELLEVRDTVKNIEHFARLKNKLLKDSRKRKFDELIDEVVASIDGNSRHGRQPIDRESRLPGGEVSKLIADLVASHRKAANYARQFDGFEDGGAFWEAVILPLNEAGHTETIRRAEVAEKLRDLFKAYSKKEIAMSLYKQEHIPEINGSLTKMGQLMVALNWGNKDNQTKLMEGHGWNAAQVEAILNRLNKRDWEFVQGVWDLVNSFWPEIRDMSKRVDGIAPQQVEASPVQTKFGEYKGGYYPIMYDDRISPKAYAHTAKEAAEQAMRGAAVRSTTKHGHRKNRVEGVKMAIRLDFGTLFEHLDTVLHDLTHYETLIDVNRILGDKRMQEAILQNYGHRAYAQLRAWLNDVATGDRASKTPFERTIDHLRAGMSISAMGMNIMTGLVQPLSLTQSIVRIGPKWVAKGAATWLGESIGLKQPTNRAEHMESVTQWVYSKSDFLKGRSRILYREINEIRNRLTLRGVILDDAAHSFFYLVVKLQLIADIPTWIGAYEKYMSEMGPVTPDFTTEMMEKKAAAMADQAVIDAQSGGMVKDLAMIQRGSPLMKVWTSFYHFFSSTFNMVFDSAIQFDRKDPHAYPKLVSDMFLLLMAPAMLSLMLKASARGDEYEDWDEALLREFIAYTMGTMVGLREFGALVQGFQGWEGPAGTRFFSDVGKLAKEAEDMEFDEKFFRALNRVTGVVFHYPSTQLDRSYRGIKALSQGDTDRPTAILTGPPIEN